VEDEIRPRTDPEAKHKMGLRLKELLLTPEERLARVEAAMQVRGIRNIAQLAVSMGTYQSSVMKSVTCRRPSAPAMLALSLALEVPLDYLILKDWEKGETK